MRVSFQFPQRFHTATMMLRLRSLGATVRIQSRWRITRPESTAAAASSTEMSFQYPKAEILFEKITSSLQTAEQVHALQAIVLQNLGRERRAQEFYYDGFGGKKGKGKGGGDGAKDEEVAAPTAFDVKLVSFDAKAKIKVIKEVRSLLGLGLKEAKELVDSAPSMLQKQVSSEAAEETKAKLIELGAVVELV